MPTQDIKRAAAFYGETAAGAGGLALSGAIPSHREDNFG
jgi:hypothetical protein